MRRTTNRKQGEVPSTINIQPQTFIIMKKFILTTILALCVLPVLAQLNVQVHYDFGEAIYGEQLSNRPHWTATIENFTPDKWGSTYFFAEGEFGDNTVMSGYAEIARELQFWKAPFAVHIEYNGGLSAETGGYDDAYLAGGAWNWANSDFTRTFSVQLLYKYMARQAKNNRHSWQLTTVWGIHFAKGLCSFIGYADLWQDKRVNGSLVLSSEPQFWVNLNALKGVNDKFNLSLGGEVEICHNLVWPANGINNRFYAIPTLALKWTF